MDPTLKAFKREICDRLRDSASLPPYFQLDEHFVWARIWLTLPGKAQAVLGEMGENYSIFFAQSAYRGRLQPILCIHQPQETKIAWAAHWDELDALCKGVRLVSGVDMIHIVGRDMAIACRFNNCNHQWIRETLPLPSDWQEAG